MNMGGIQTQSGKAGPGKLTLRELTERTLLQLAAPTGALVNGCGDILYVNNILQMGCEGLRDELTSALNRATTSGEVVRRTGLRVDTNGGYITANLTIMKVVTGPTPTPEAPLYLIFLEEVAPPISDRSTSGIRPPYPDEFDTPPGF